MASLKTLKENKKEVSIYVMLCVVILLCIFCPVLSSQESFTLHSQTDFVFC